MCCLTSFFRSTIQNDSSLSTTATSPVLSQPSGDFESLVAASFLQYRKHTFGARMHISPGVSYPTSFPSSSMSIHSVFGISWPTFPSSLGCSCKILPQVTSVMPHPCLISTLKSLATAFCSSFARGAAPHSMPFRLLRSYFAVSGRLFIMTRIGGATCRCVILYLCMQRKKSS